MFECVIVYVMFVFCVLVSDIYYIFFCEKLVSLIVSKLYIVVFKCKCFLEIGG